jgi:P pilus assembly chaperone PapD
MTARIVLLSLLFLFGAETMALAQEHARVDLAPRRVILSPRDRSGDFTLLNLGKAAGTIKMDIIHYRQGSDGVYTELDGPLNPLFDPATVIRLSPRQFTLESEQVQKVRFSIRKPADLPDGEYRFHIRALRLADPGPIAPGDKGQKIVMAMNFGAAIPVIVRHGTVSVTATMDNISLVENGTGNKPELHFNINRSGNISTIGKMEALWQPQGREAQILGTMSNLNIFTEVDVRNVKMPIRFVPQGPGTIHLKYINDEDQNGTVYAEATLQR